MKLNKESKNLVDILNVYLEEINEELLNNKDALELLYEKKNVQEEMNKQSAANSIRYNAFAPRKNDTLDSSDEQNELLGKIKALEDTVKIQKEKVDSIQKSITDFMDAFDSIPDPTEIKEVKEEVNEEKKEDIKEEVVEEKKVSCETASLDNTKLKNTLLNISSKLDDVTYTTIYDYKKTISDIKSVKKLLDDTIDNI